MKEWRLDDDPLKSAKLLLENTTASGSSDGGIEMIEIDSNVDYDCLTFSLLEILKEWDNCINELVTDLACK